MIEDFLKKINFQKNKKIILGGILTLFILILGFSYCSTPVKNTARQDMALNILPMGALPALSQAMEENGTLRSKVKELLDYDEQYMFTNYKQVNDLVEEIMFLWIGLPPRQIKRGQRQQLAEYFIQTTYNLPEGTPIKNNPLLEKYPWASLFQRIKAKLLMQGRGYKVFDGVAYYDSTKDKMVVEGELSSDFTQTLFDFIKAQPQKEQQKYINNYLMFVDETLGLKNVSNEERAFLKEQGYIK